MNYLICAVHPERNALTIVNGNAACSACAAKWRENTEQFQSLVRPGKPKKVKRAAPGARVR